MEAPMPDLDPEFREIVDNNFWDMMEAPMNVLERKRVKCSAFKNEVNTHRNAAPINAETVRELLDERDGLRSEVERLTQELTEAKKENGNLFDRLRMMAQEVTSRDGDIERLEAELAAEREKGAKNANGCRSDKVHMVSAFRAVRTDGGNTVDTTGAVRGQRRSALGKKPR
jgi:predicted nuclease with TOPRIM domain